MKVAFIIITCLLFFIEKQMAQTKIPRMFSMQDKFAKKNIKKYITHDTLIATSDAILHISYSNENDKPTLLLLHGMGANARTNWSSQIKTLSKSFNLILPDLIYFGESTSNSQNYSVEFQVEQIHEAVLKLGFTKKINVMGFSYGGLTAAMYNQLYLQDVQKLIIVDGPVKFFSAQMADSVANSLGINGLYNVISPITIAGFNAMSKAAMSKTFPLTKKIKRKIINYYFIPNKEIRDKQMIYLIDNSAHYQSLNYNLAETQTLLIWGSKDGVIPLRVGLEINKSFPNTTKLVLFPKAKHDAHFREAKKFNKTITAFIKGTLK
jgi:pimeloyl-ACP methyl ester carboxylesterase